ncbi:hypothetical protein AX14_014088 [Amanita brunnescens Koide BX004]|nr:hypothetical protein AX14_014088 [Amanita brunnescens Koide BX004]
MVLNGHTDEVNSVAFSAVGTRIISGSNDTSVRVWDALTGAELKVLNGHTSTVNSVAFSTDGRRIVSGSLDESVRVWDALTGAELKVLNGHTGTIYCVAFSSDSTCIISGSHDHSVRVWDAFTGIELKVLNGHTSPVFSIAFSTDGTRIVSGSAAPNSVRVWDASIDADSPASVIPNFHRRSITSPTDSTSGIDEESAQLDQFGSWRLSAYVGTRAGLSIQHHHHFPWRICHY